MKIKSGDEFRSKMRKDLIVEVLHISPSRVEFRPLTSAQLSRSTYDCTREEFESQFIKAVPTPTLSPSIAVDKIWAIDPTIPEGVAEEVAERINELMHSPGLTFERACAVMGVTERNRTAKMVDSDLKRGMKFVLGSDFPEYGLDKGAVLYFIHCVRTDTQDGPSERFVFSINKSDRSKTHVFGQFRTKSGDWQRFLYRPGIDDAFINLHETRVIEGL